jgi:ABC-type antimicrobial peptide transport system permease subunit
VTAGIFSAVCIGAIAGVGLAMASARYVASLLYQVKATDPGVLAFPSVIILVTALLAAVPAVIRALRIDPAAMLRAE